MQDEGWIVVTESRRRWDCHEQALVLDALGIPHLIADGPRNAALLLVPAEHAERARDQLRQYQAENRARPVLPAVQLQGTGIPGVLLYALVLLAVFVLQGRTAAGIDWLDAGGLQGTAIRNGEWWRVITALTLHGDAGHLVANLAFGAFFGAFAGQYLGSGVAWATILAAAACGNALDISLLPASHRAIGASTAVFAALGLIAALMWRMEARRASTWARRFAPLIGAGVLLAYIGTGNAQTDAVAHLTGFVAGLLAGAAYGVRRPRALSSPGLQFGAGLCALTSVAACWWLAVNAWRASLA